MKILQPEIFKQFPEIICGFSTKHGLDRTEPYFFNLSYSVEDDEKKVAENREAFFSELGIQSKQVALQRQTHSDIITIVNHAGVVGESDAMITAKRNIGLAISAADCTPIFLYDAESKVIAAVHAGWRGAQKQILLKTIKKLEKDFKTNLENVFVYIGPTISQQEYEVGEEVANQFNPSCIEKVKDKFYLDVLSANVDQLEGNGVPINQIEISPYCTYKEKNLLHSYRRDGKKSGRHLGIIFLKGE